MRDTETLMVSGDAKSLFQEKRIEVKCWAAALPRHNTVALLLKGQTRHRPSDALLKTSWNLSILQLLFFSDNAALHHSML